VFLVDVSGSMSGQPTAKVVEAMQGMLKLCRPQDTVQVITFASQAQKLFDKPVPVNEGNIGKALGFTAGLQGRGGTEMLKGVQMAIDEPIDKERLRIVVMLTDGYIGNEAQIIEHVGKHCGDQIRFWCVGIGSAPNMFLVDGVARQGGGMGKALGLSDESQPLVQEIMTRIQRAQLAKITIDWGTLKVSETFPAKIPELWAGRPVIVFGRYDQPDNFDEAVIAQEITIRGNVEGEDVSWPLRVELPMTQKANDVLAKTWARQKIEDLMHQTYYQGSPAVEEMVTGIALDYRLMSQYTSFVAVDDKAAPLAEPAKPPRRMLVPVPLPEGTRWEGFFGGEREELREAEFAFGMRYKGEAKKLAELSELAGAARPRLRSFHFHLEQLGRDGRQQSQLNRLYAGSQLATRAALLPAIQPALSGPAGGWREGYGRYDRYGGFGGANGAAAGREVWFSRRGGAIALGKEGRTQLALGLDFDADFFDGVQVQDGEFAYAATALAAQSGKAAEAARKALETATAKEAPQDRAALRRLFTRACLLDLAAAGAGQSDGSVASQAIERLSDLHEQDVKEWSAKLPQLQAKLDLVIRDASLAEALAQVGKAAKLKVGLVEGSLADATALTGQEPRISYLDLRHATVAQALDWILQPARLTWSPEDQSIVATSDRRRSGESAWIYDVAAIALPLSEDLTKLNDHQKAVAESQKAADEFLTAIRQALKADGDEQVLWYAPGQLLVFGDAKRHAATAAAIDALEEGNDRPADELGALSEVTRKRFAARKEKLAKAQAAGRKLDVASAHEQFSWQLLAAAYGGQLDLESLTELQIAWKSAETGELLAGPARPLVMRSLFTICEASRTLSNEKELAALATAARSQAKTAADAALAALDKDRKDTAALAGVLYAALANPDDEYRAKALPLLVPIADEGEAAAGLRTLARVLIGKRANVDRAALAEMLTRDPGGADLIVLLAIASREAGGQTWSTFRAQSRDLLGSQPLPGEVVVLVNRM
jgi:hypothetical protein